MDAILEAVGKLFLVFKDPVNVILLLVCFAESAVIYKIMRFFMDNWQKDMESRVKQASSFEALAKAIQEGK